MSSDTNLSAVVEYMHKTRIELTNSWAASLSTCGRGVTPATGGSMLTVGCCFCCCCCSCCVAVSCSKADRNGLVAVDGRGLFKRGEGAPCGVRNAGESGPGELVLGLRNGLFELRFRDSPGERRCSAVGGTGAGLSVINPQGSRTYHGCYRDAKKQERRREQTWLAGLCERRHHVVDP
jgi:hypothetical protein